MKLTQTHIEELYNFTRKHYVYFYDVQTELVDHLANDIEQICEETPTLSFEQARDTSFKKFGIFGFMDVIESKQKAMNKRYWKIIVRFVKEWFTVPKIVITISIFFFFFVMIQIKYSEYYLLGTLALLVIYDMINLVIRKKKNKTKKKVKEKVFLLESMIGGTRNSFTAITFINIFNIINLTKFNFSSLEIYWVILISAVATLLCILFYVSNYVIPQKAEELLQETYPEYKIVNNL